MDGTKTTARVIVTYECNRHCPGCCNGYGNAVRKIKDIRELLQYKEIVITGGEPMLLGEKLFNFLDALRDDNNYKGRIYLYTAFFEARNMLHHTILSRTNGITYTIHAEATDTDIGMLKQISRMPVLDWPNFSSRLIIDNRLYDRYDFSNIELTNWDVVRKLQWKDYCEPAPNEELVEFLL